MKIKKPIFWKSKNFLSYLFYPLTFFTFLINKLKKLKIKKKYPIKSICVGNIYIGGTGKTSLSIKIYNLLKKKYKSVLIKKKLS